MSLRSDESGDSDNSRIGGRASERRGGLERSDIGIRSAGVRQGCLHVGQHRSGFLSIHYKIIRKFHK